VSHVVVVGGGIAGLACAYELLGGAAGPAGATATVTVLESGKRFGGKLRCAQVAGRMVDVGPDGFLARRPEAVALISELGATELLEPIGAQGAWVFARGRLRLLPPGLALGVPTRLRDLRTKDAVGILGVAGAARAALDLVAPRQPSRSALEDRAIGPLVGDKLGHRVVDMLIDPLIGGIHAGRVKDLSAAAVYPPILAAGQVRGSLMRALQAKAAVRDPGPEDESAGSPAFYTLCDGVGTLPELVAATLRDRGAELATGATATGLHRGAPGRPRWVVETEQGPVEADAVVLATPAAATSSLLGPVDAEAAAMVGSIDAAGVAVVTLRFAADAIPLPESGTGVLVPIGSAAPEDRFMVTAVTFLDRKWPHLAREGEVLLRASVGRIDDDRWMGLDDADLVERVLLDLSILLGELAEPTAAVVTRWVDAFPQYRVNHLVRVDGVDAAVSALGGLAVAGASYRGVGIPACIGSGRTSARNIRAWLADQS
jgi:oxygen-dependent protoporphyrinogen oxidase